MATRTRAPATIPQFGTIEGGVLHGWNFAFERVVYAERKLYLDLRVTAPNWPFGKTVRFGPRSFRKLTAGYWAKKHEARPLFDEARQLAKTRKH